MSHPPKKDGKAPTQQVKGLLQSGIIFSVISFITSLGNLAFQSVLGSHLKAQGEYGSANSAISAFIPLLGLIPAMATFAVTHYIAHFNSIGDHARLEGLLLGCRKFLLHLTVAGSLLAVIIVKPLSIFFHYPESLMLVTLMCTLLGLWSVFAVALSQGLAWFKRLALIGFLAMVLRVVFGWFITLNWPSAETAVLASAFALLANLLVLCWRKELSLHGRPVSPWNREFVHYFIVSAAFVIGNFCFFQSDFLVAQHYFGKIDSSKTSLDAYAAAGILARALPMTVMPLLAVLFTSRSGQRSGNIVAEQLKLACLSGFGLIFGAICLFTLRAFCLKLLHRNTPEAAAMIGSFTTTMVFVGLLQTLAYWVLASRWAKIALLYGALGLSYTLVLLALGKSPSALLQTMPVAAGAAFLILFAAWLVTMRRHRHAV